MFGTALQGFLAVQRWQIQSSCLGALAQAWNSSLSHTPVPCRAVRLYMAMCCAANVQIGGSSSGVNSVYYQSGICTIPVSLLTMLHSCSGQSILLSAAKPAQRLHCIALCCAMLRVCPALPCPALPCPALPCPALPCPALPCPALPCPLMCFVHGDDEVWLIWVDGYLPCL